jgi:hypothetical protein
MRKFALFGAAAATLALSGCGGVPTAVFAGLGAAGPILSMIGNVTEAVAPVIATACGEYGRARAAANAVLASGIIPASAHVKVASIESFGDAACANPPSGDPLSTAIWLGQLVGQIVTLTGTKLAA